MLKCPSVSSGVSASVTTGQYVSPAKWILRWRGIDHCRALSEWSPNNSYNSENAPLCSCLFNDSGPINTFFFFSREDKKSFLSN